MLSLSKHGHVVAVSSSNRFVLRDDRAERQPRLDKLGETWAPFDKLRVTL